MNLVGTAKEKSLFSVVQQGDIAELKELIQAGVNLNVVNSKGHTALWLAACHNYIDIVSALLASGADVNEGKPLAIAAECCHWEIVRLLIQAGADVNVSVDEDFHATPLFYAQAYREPEILRLLRQQGAKHKWQKSLAKMRGVDSFMLEHQLIIVKAPVEQVAREFCQRRKATVWQRDVFEREVVLTEQSFIVLRFAGHRWTVIYEKNNPSENNRLNEKDAQYLSRTLQTSAVYYACSDASAFIRYHLLEWGKSVEKVALLSENSPQARKAYGHANSEIREINLDDIRNPYEFIDTFFQSQDAYIPAFGGRSSNTTGQRVTLAIAGLDPEDIQQMHFVGV